MVVQAVLADSSIPLARAVRPSTTEGGGGDILRVRLFFNAALPLQVLDACAAEFKSHRSGTKTALRSVQSFPAWIGTEVGTIAGLPFAAVPALGHCFFGTRV